MSDIAPLTHEQIATRIADHMEDFYVDLFVNGCVIETLKQTIESPNSTLSDSDPSFTEENIATMKKCTLDKIEFNPEREEGNNTFKIKTGNGENEYILFSNRDNNNGEMRGNLLKDELDKLKEQNPKTNLYDALTHLMRDPKQNVTFMSVPVIYEINKNKPLESQIKKHTLIDTLTQINRASMRYVTNGRKKEPPISDQKLIGDLKQTISLYKKELFLSALDDPNTTSDTLLKYINERKIALEIIGKEPDALIDSVMQHISKNRKLAKENPILNKVADATERLLYHTLAQSSGKVPKDTERTETLKADFKSHMESAKRAQEEKSSTNSKPSSDTETQTTKSQLSKLVGAIKDLIKKYLPSKKKQQTWMSETKDSGEEKKSETLQM